ncbi:hypothetical protein BpHYR1_007956 [Brachionus plicatilis]|uniref:Uncharacterized protein n=1 Tax=Brachionus plicatilis TaxID=10195 RepID=A0A3M7QAQ0_BRAPC|nr:hypothetical protein BpHYR1_007956 [Brachionus plicatilis]
MKGWSGEKSYVDQEFKDYCYRFFILITKTLTILLCIKVRKDGQNDAENRKKREIVVKTIMIQIRIVVMAMEMDAARNDEYTDA